LVSFSVGKYKNEVFCDVMPIHTTHLLLGRPWWFNRKAKNGGFKNMYSLAKNKKTSTLVPVSHRQVYEGQLKLKRERKA